MPQINLDFSEVEEYELVPEGNYQIEVIEAEVGTSSTGKAMMTLQMEIQTPEFEGRKVFDNLMLEGNALWRTKQTLQTLLGSVPEGAFQLDTQDIIGVRCMVYIAHRVWKVEDGGDGSARPDVRRYYVPEGGEDIEDLFA